MAEDTEAAESKEKQFCLNAESQLNLFVEDKNQAVLELRQGLAEVFGTEVQFGKKYVFKPNTRVAVFTWHGCLLVIRGQISYKVVRETPMVIYANIHAAIEQMRQVAAEKYAKGPCVLVAGPCDVGKSTTCQILLNYAVRQGRNPVFIDLDVGQGQISIPGTIGALRMSSTVDIEDGFMQQNAMVYHIGLKSPGHDIILYNRIISQLAESMNSRAKKNVAVSHNGIIINTCGWVVSDGYRAITQAILAFEVDVVLVLGTEHLYHQITRDVPRFVKVVYVPRFSEAIERSRHERIEERDQRICQYFYGCSVRMNPNMIQVPFSTLRIYKIGQEKTNRNIPGAKYFDQGICLVPVIIDSNLLNHVLSVTFSKELDENAVYMNVAGFVCVNQVDMASQELTLLSPQPPPLPSTIFLYSHIIFDKQL